MAEFIGLFGRVADVKAVKSLGVCRVVIEVPREVSTHSRPKAAGTLLCPR